MGAASRRKLEQRKERACAECATCAFRRRENFDEDPDLTKKLRRAFETGRPFLCHEKMTTNLMGEPTLPRKPDGSVDWDDTRVCGGFLRRAGEKWRRERPCQGPAK